MLFITEMKVFKRGEVRKQTEQEKERNMETLWRKSRKEKQCNQTYYIFWGQQNFKVIKV